MKEQIPARVTDCVRDHLDHFTEHDLVFLNLEIYRNWISETREHTILAYFKFTYLLDYWSFTGKISPNERTKLIALFREANNITDDDIRRVKK